MDWMCSESNAWNKSSTKRLARQKGMETERRKAQDDMKRIFYTYNEIRKKNTWCNPENETKVDEACYERK